MSHHLSEFVKRWRVTNDLKQEEAAARFGISQGSLSRIENGLSMPDRATARLMVAAGVFTAEQLGQAMLAPATGEAA